MQVIAFKTGKWVAGVVCSFMFGGLHWRFTLLSVALLYGIGVAIVYVCRGSTHGSTSAEVSTGKLNACLAASGHATPFPSATAPSSPPRAALSQADMPSQATTCSPQQLPVSSSSSSSSSLSLIQVLFPAATPLCPHCLSVIVSHLQVVRCLCSDGMLLAITLLAMTNKYCCWLTLTHFFSRSFGTRHKYFCMFGELMARQMMLPYLQEHAQCVATSEQSRV
jgi:hypothetical protein